MADNENARKRYWRRNLRLVVCLLGVWFFVSCVLGIFLVEFLNQYRFPLKGFPFGFWIAQQGAIYVFIGLILIYALRMDKLDKDLKDDSSNGKKDE